jgi:hypothetical protein
VAKTPARKPAKKKPPAGPKAAKRPVRASAPPPPPPPPPAPPAGGPADDYRGHRDRMAGRSRDRSTAGREVGPLPPVADPARKASGRASLERFCRAYFPARFRLAFSAAHREALTRLERCTDEGGLFALAFQRGGGKTTMAEVAALRAILYGLRRFVVLVQATERLAARSLKKIQRELEANDLLAADFPEVCHPIRALERNTTRARMQTLGGEPTRMEWTGEGVVLPTVAGSPASGAVVYVAGLLGAIRGLSVPGPAGEMLRPDLVVIDDAQTRDSAKSPTQTADREAVIIDDVLGLAGPDAAIAAVNLCTPIYLDDLAERLLDPDRHPEWNGARTRMLESLPARADLWDQYAELYRESQRAGDRGRRAAAFYRLNRAEMDRGAVASWPERTTAGPVKAQSAVELAMILRLTNPRGFAAEYQCEPEDLAASASVKRLDPAEVGRRLSGLPRFEVPREAARVTAFVDCGGGRGRGIWYAVVAWDGAFGGSVLDYGAWPRQARTHFAADDMRPGLAERFPEMAPTARLYAGLSALAAEVLGREYHRERGGGVLRVERCLVDAGYLSQAVYQWARQTPYAGVVYPSKGVGRTTTSRGVGEWKPRPGERSGHHWRLTVSETGRGQMVQFDPDSWKTRLHEMLTTPLGSPGALTLFARDGDRAADHAMIGEHLAAESSEPQTIRGTTFDKWAERPDRPDNHLLDCLVGCAVAAAVQGLTWSAAAAAGDAPAKKARRRVGIGELYAEARARDEARAKGRAEEDQRRKAG